MMERFLLFACRLTYSLALMPFERLFKALVGGRKKAESRRRQFTNYIFVSLVIGLKPINKKVQNVALFMNAAPSHVTAVHADYITRQNKNNKKFTVMFATKTMVVTFIKAVLSNIILCKYILL